MTAATRHRRARDRPQAQSGSNNPLIHEKVTVPAPITAQVATVRQSASVPVNCQMASTEATTAMRMHAVVIQKDHRTTSAGRR